VEKSEPTQQPTLTRQLRDLRHIASRLKRSHMTPLQVGEAIIEKRLVDPDTRVFFSNLPDDERHYWIASLYALLMPKATRRRLAAYFTPPFLAHHAIDALTNAGIKLGQHRILDPASGGAAFLVPLAARIATLERGRGKRAKEIIQSINGTLHGVEIDTGIAGLSQALLANLLDTEIGMSGLNLNGMIENANMLRLDRPGHLYDAVIGNPPYGRILRPSSSLLTRYRAVISDGYVNLYALFVEQALQWVRPGGIICLIIPMSFVGGPYFAALRKRIIESASVVRLDLVDKRSDVFLDVLYDLCVIVLRRNDGSAPTAVARTSLLLTDQPARELGTLELPAEPSNRVWALPDSAEGSALFQPELVTLGDYGYLTKTGYFVWNREQHRYRVGRRPRPNEVPLFWANNVRANEPCVPRVGSEGRIGFARLPKSSSAIIHSDAIILQRTSNRRQKRRLIGAIIQHAEVIGARGFVTENHTIVVVPDPAKRQQLPLWMVCRLLNTTAVDARFRRMSGSVSVSTKALRDLPLPIAADVRRFFNPRDRSDEEAAIAAYAASAGRRQPANTGEFVKAPRRRRRP
jgi:adenine-specific DNA-methyltransferase